MHDDIIDWLDVDQYGGVRGLSTTHALVDMVQTWFLAAEERKASHVVLLDYRKAFDHVESSTVKLMTSPILFSLVVCIFVR